MKRKNRANEELEKLRSLLLEESEDKETVIIVEGRRDYRTLKNLGVNTDKIILYSINSKEKLAKILEKSERVIVFTDFDKEGMKIEKEIKNLCQSIGIQFDVKIKREFFRRLREITGKSIRDVEGILNLYI